MAPLISVIVPVYNVGELLNLCLQSIVTQKYYNLDIIVVDDGSTDSSRDLCDKWKKKDSRITVIHKKNGGLSDARNVGLRLAKGDYLAFIDSDDFLNVNFFSELMGAMLSNNAEIAACGMIFYNDKNEINDFHASINPIGVLKFSSIEAQKEYLSPKSTRLLHHGVCMKIYKKELFNGLLFDEGKLHEDLFLTYKLLNKCHTLVYVNAHYYYYFQNNIHSINHNYGIKNFMDESEAYREIYNFYKKKKELHKEMINFLILQYFSLFIRSYKFIADKKIKTIKKEIIGWIDKNIDECDCIRDEKKFLLRFYIKNIRFYCLFKRITGR